MMMIKKFQIVVFVFTFVLLQFQPSAVQCKPQFDRFKEDYDWLISMINPKTLLTLSAEDPLNQHNSYTYTNALTLIMLVLRGEPKDIDLASRIVQSMRNLQDEDGAWADAFHIQTGQITAWNRATGPNSWMVLALLHYYKKTKDPLAWEMAQKATDWLLTHQDSNRNHFTYGAIKLGDAFPYSEVRNTEANANCLAAFYAMSVLAEKPLDRIRYRQAARMIAQFLTEKLWREDHFAVAILNAKGDFSTFPELLDSQTWTLLSLDATEKLHNISASKYASALNWLLKHKTRVNNVEGFSKVTFSYDPRLDTDGDGSVDNSIWVEGVCGAVLAFRIIGDSNHADTFYTEIEKLRLPTRRLPHIVGPPQLHWPYNLPFPSVGALWTIFADPEINFNPFYVSD